MADVSDTSDSFFGDVFSVMLTLNNNIPAVFQMLSKCLSAWMSPHGNGSFTKLLTSST